MNPPRGILRIRISVKASGINISGALLIPTYARSSTGRAAVSKTAGRWIEANRVCHTKHPQCEVTATWSATVVKSARADANSKKTAKNSSSNAKRNTVHAGSAECQSTTTPRRTPQTTATTSTTSIPTASDLQHDPAGFRPSHTQCNNLRGNKDPATPIGTLSRQWIRAA